MTDWHDPTQRSAGISRLNRACAQVNRTPAQAAEGLEYAIAALYKRRWGGAETVVVDQRGDQVQLYVERRIARSERTQPGELSLEEARFISADPEPGPVLVPLEGQSAARLIVLLFQTSWSLLFMFRLRQAPAVRKVIEAFAVAAGSTRTPLPFAHGQFEATDEEREQFQDALPLLVSWLRQHRPLNTPRAERTETWVEYRRIFERRLGRRVDAAEHGLAALAAFEVREVKLGPSEPTVASEPTPPTEPTVPDPGEPRVAWAAFVPGERMHEIWASVRSRHAQTALWPVLFPTLIDAELACEVGQSADNATIGIEREALPDATSAESDEPATEPRRPFPNLVEPRPQLPYPLLLVRAPSSWQAVAQLREPSAWPGRNLLTVLRTFELEHGAVVRTFCPYGLVELWLDKPLRDEQKALEIAALLHRISSTIVIDGDFVAEVTHFAQYLLDAHIWLLNLED